jgi:two-component system, sensor histidine kinase and response regulator
VTESASRSDTLAALATGHYDVAFVAAQIGDVSPAAVAAAGPGARAATARLVLCAADGPALRTTGPTHFAAVLAKPWRRATLRRTLLAALGATPVDGAVASDWHAPPSGVRVLVAEDDAASRRVVLSILERTGAHVGLVRNGREAVDAFSRAVYDLVLMDIQMPEMDGFEATRRIRAHERDGGGHVPIVAITAHAMPGDRERCLAAGMDDYLTKPIRLADLDRLLENLGRVPVADAAAAS